MPFFTMIFSAVNFFCILSKIPLMKILLFGERAGNALLANELRVLDSHAELLGQELRILDGRLAAQDNEFFATPAHQAVAVADLALDKLGEVHEHLVAHVVVFELACSS